MMKSVQPVALLLMIMMMMMMIGSVSAGPLPPSPNHSRDDDQDAGSLHLLEDGKENSTRFESRQNVNNTLGNFTGSVTLNSGMNETGLCPFVMSPQRCILPTCLTANLGSSLQVGDEKAGGATTDPFGVGKK
ncbi:uncharacterized protein zgc:193726 isoform X3 [Xiphias gladius]|uniref:uncharacterized protein zgc:193726 isoform X3 n=1 Tax=Xiphias gladius TaxID=8245 RepID=UPI001A9A18AA|nr:uncharacterized protein zgc:193726 isoform X3 [Xiphias gladius]